MDEFQKKRAEIALRRIDSEKSIKKFKLEEHFQNVRLSSLLRMPYTVIKQHNTTHMTVSPINGLMRFQLSDSIPIQKFLQRSDATTFEKWLEVNHPEEHEKYQADTFGFLFGKSGTDLTYTADVQALMDEYDKFRWCQTETERKYYFSALLSGHDLTTFSEFDLFGSVGHTPEEVEDFRQECILMQADFEANPSAFFNPVADAPAVPAE